MSGLKKRNLWWAFRLKPTISALLTAGFLFVSSTPSDAHIENGILTEDFQIDEVKIVQKGPFIPGDIIAFSVISNLSKTNWQWIQVTGSCLTYPAEWHRNTEQDFEQTRFVRKAQAVAVISSGCESGIHEITEVILADSSNNYTRVTTEEFDLPSFEVKKGHLRPSSTGFTGTNLKRDRLSVLSIPQQVRLKPGLLQTPIVNLPRTTDGGQVLEWVTTGPCGIRKTMGASDLGGVLWVSSVGTCVISLNTPWGSNLFTPLNQAQVIEVFPATALSCSSKMGKVTKVSIVLATKCPKGFKKTK